MHITPIHDGFAAQISGVHLASPLSDDTFTALREADTYAAGDRTLL